MTGIHGLLWEMRAMPLLVHSVSGLHQLYPLAQYFSRSVGMVFDAIHLRNWLKLNWTHDCTLLCEAEDERSNSQFVCILSGNVVQRISRLLWFSKDIHVKISPLLIQLRRWI